MTAEADSAPVKDPLIEGRQTGKYVRLFRIAWIFELGTALLVVLIHTVYLKESVSLGPLLAALLSIAGINMVAFAVNDYFDREIDARHPTARLRNPIVTGEISLNHARLVILLVAGVTLALSAVVGRMAVLMSAAYMLIGVIYVAPPLRLKARVGLDVLAHMFTVFSFTYLFMVVNMRSFQWRSLDTILYINQVIASVMIQLSQEYFDFEHDREVERNTAIALGRRGTLLAIRAAHGAYFLVTVAGFAAGMLPLWLFGYSLLFGVRLVSVFNSEKYEQVVGVYRLGVLLWTIFLAVRHFFF